MITKTSTQSSFRKLFLTIVISMNRTVSLECLFSSAMDMGMCPDSPFDPDSLASCSSLNDEIFK